VFFYARSFYRFTDSSPSAAGTVTQVRECAVRLLQYAKLSGVPVLLVGHVTKSGDLAGPRVLEHLVDAGAQGREILDSVTSAYLDHHFFLPASLLS
jgi:hypothetical protein